jgi:hypothetical protein
VLFPTGSPFLKKDRLADPEVYNMVQSVLGRIQSIVNIHNPSIEAHPVDKGINTGALVILVPGGGHNTRVLERRRARFSPVGTH